MTTEIGWVFVAISMVFIIICVGVGAVAAEMYARLNQNPPWAQDLGNQINNVRNRIMAAVQIDQDDLTAFAATVETEVANLTAASGVLAGYIQQLLANQATPLPAADETAITTALTDLGTSVSTLDALEPPAPTPGS